ncbi:MAG TPA: DUF1499 domain-containing protein [Nitrospiraceae bacterium]|nr:DUF1499 domain-containing protein [Nitrospiraceae bacterium]
MKRAAVWSLGGLILAVASALAAIFAGLGSRWDWWHFRTGFQILTVAAYGGLAAVVVSVMGALAALSQRSRRHMITALIGLGIGAITVWIPWQLKQTARRVPAIHDLTTDTAMPPVFVAILPLRKEAPNSSDYGGPEIAEQQRSAYPSLGPLVLDIAPVEAFKEALAAAREMGWEIVDTHAETGRIEATDTTFWFGFKDDIVVRVAPGTDSTPAKQTSRIDVRSVSRVGKSDVGANAKRIRTYLNKIRHNSQAHL